MSVQKSPSSVESSVQQIASFSLSLSLCVCVCVYVPLVRNVGWGEWLSWGDAFSHFHCQNIIRPPVCLSACITTTCALSWKSCCGGGCLQGPSCLLCWKTGRQEFSVPGYLYLYVCVCVRARIFALNRQTYELVVTSRAHCCELLCRCSCYMRGRIRA